MDTEYVVTFLQKLANGDVVVSLQENVATPKVSQTATLPAASPLIGTLTIGKVLYGRVQLAPF